MDVLLIGSSVAHGLYASEGKSWAALLGHALKTQYNMTMKNIAVPGFTTISTQKQLNNAFAYFASSKPKYVIVSLSLWNEGLHTCSTRDMAQKFINHYLTNMIHIVNTIKAAGAQPIVCSVYPNQLYSELHREVLYFIHSYMRTYKGCYIDFMSVTDNGQGLWKPNMIYDAAHPNDIGHRAMFDAIDLGIFSQAN